MALTTYQNLLDAIASYLGHGLLTGDQDDDLVTLFEACANRRLRTRQMEQQATITMSGGAGTLPTDYLAVRSVIWPGDTRIPLEYVTPEWMDAAYPDSSEGTPKYFTIQGSTIRVRPSSDTSLEFNYFEKINALSGEVNWLYSAHPDLYLFGSLAEAEMFFKDDPRAVLWKQRRDELFDEIQKLSNKTRGPLAAIRPVGPIV